MTKQFKHLQSHYITIKNTTQIQKHKNNKASTLALESITMPLQSSYKTITQPLQPHYKNQYNTLFKTITSHHQTSAKPYQYCYNHITRQLSYYKTQQNQNNTNPQPLHRHCKPNTKQVQHY